MKLDLWVSTSASRWFTLTFPVELMGTGIFDCNSAKRFGMEVLLLREEREVEDDQRMEGWKEEVDEVDGLVKLMMERRFDDGVEI